MLVGLICGLVCGYLIYAFASRATLTTFLVAMTNFLLLIGAGLFSKAVGDFQRNAFNKLLGSDVDDAGGDGPGSYDVRGAIWHLDCCNPENNTDGTGWGIFNALFGWDNTGTGEPLYSSMMILIHKLNFIILFFSWYSACIYFLLVDSSRSSCIHEILRRPYYDLWL